MLGVIQYMHHGLYSGFSNSKQRLDLVPSWSNHFPKPVRIKREFLVTFIDPVKEEQTWTSAIYSLVMGMKFSNKGVLILLPDDLNWISNLQKLVFTGIDVEGPELYIWRRDNLS